MHVKIICVIDLGYVAATVLTFLFCFDFKPQPFGVQLRMLIYVFRSCWGVSFSCFEVYFRKDGRLLVAVVSS